MSIKDMITPRAKDPKKVADVSKKVNVELEVDIR